ncbi:MAG TPA: efflux RND transporter periplasmic adaptor subunit [bacterium]|nr:efflux RND transporter periplasmic adaptor subunit [bacterium]HPG35356.1 efflux RND transporter periplasmic adaptor subunit [bacterium]HQJ61055.1 efflux RND transporter periplasmic adaptor subunit [bacterium]HQN72160.1 efflux RND transporter periplasmic adaptor subunit [bacterium]HQO91383.1 efflux RND transporter periplasmic adaptor subunit [bacterium]
MKKYLVIPIIFIFAVFSSCQKVEPTVLTLSGTVESKDVRISSLVGGRITEVNYDEGDEVKKDSIIAKIDCRDYELQLAQAETVISGAKAKLRLIKSGARKEDIASASESNKQAQIALDKANKEYERFEKLFETGSVTEKELDDIKVVRDRAQSQFDQSRHILEKLQNGAQIEEIDSVIASVKQAEASKAILLKKISDCVILSPSDGTVLHRLAEPGEIASPGMAILTLSDISKVRIRAFVPEKELGHIKNGAEVQLFIDTFPKISFSGKIASISTEAEFTPKTIQTADERVKTVYEFKVIAENKDRIFKPGMPVDIVIDKTEAVF